MKNTTYLTFDDNGRRMTFTIRKMFALQLESWLLRAAAIVPVKQETSINSRPSGIAALVLQRGLLALACANPDKSAPLLDEMLCCCSLIDPGTGTEIPCSPQNIDKLASSVLVLLLLRRAAFQVNLSFAQVGARKSLVFPKESAFKRASGEQVTARAANVPLVAATLISQGMASLNDLRSTYTFSDALDLLEVVNVRNYNQWAAAEALKSRRR